MRLHPAVATALVLVGGLMLVLPVYEWLRLTGDRSAIIDIPSSLFVVSMLSGTVGLVFILIATIFSFESRSRSGNAD